MKLLAAIGALILSVHAAVAQPQRPVPLSPSSTQEVDAQRASLGLVFIFQEFLGDGDAGQCNGAAYGQIISRADQWSPTIRMDTDNRSGGCRYRIGMVDPLNALRGFMLTMQLVPDGDPGQCSNTNINQVPIVQSGVVQYTAPIRIDTDNRSGGCVQIWRASNQGAYFDLFFMPDGDPGQCGNPGTHSTQATGEIRIRLDMDNRSGGCVQSLRLRSVGRSFTDANEAGRAENMLEMEIK
jgi:hypothetical protein